MRYILEFVEFASIILTAPHSVVVAARQFERQSRYALLCSALASISLATGVFYARSSYRLSFLVLIPILAGMIFLFHRFYSRLLSARLLQHLMNSPAPMAQREGISTTLSTLLESSFLPGLFILPVCITAREFTMPALLLIPGIAAISFWILYIQFSGVRFIMETQKRPTVMLLLRNHLMLATYPFLAIYVGMLLLISLTGLR
ncbi:MAG: hypothetical protein F9K24_13860 [Leptonema illini]|jgi:hypothetical protein|uniref:Uncharacterized protein n=1 Tax=Leptonema illini TaxID=183 RepID=A0A833GZV4_9LEPT|nr:MAG: hypothetical protein F9K24_13860 [Leptonema illini]